MNSKGISVIIPNYNGENLLPEILPALFTALTNSALSFEVIISDDCSTDDSVKYVKKNYPFIILLESSVNQGFSPTINKGIFIAKYDYVLLLNSDVKLSDEYFRYLLRYFELEDTFGVVGRIVGWTDDNIQDAAKYPSFHGLKIKTSGNYYAFQPRKDHRLYSMYLSGANALVSREKLLLLGGFDELFAPFYVEDYELSLRAWRFGWKCYYDHFCVCRHKTSVSIKKKSRKRFIEKIYYRNKLFLHAMHLKGSKLFLWYLQLVPETIFSLFTFKFYFFSSLLLFFAERKKMKNSINKFDLLAKENNKQLLSVEQVTNEVKKSMELTAIKRF